MALGSVGGPIAKRVLLQCLQSDEEVVEQAAQMAMGSVELEDNPLGFRLDHEGPR